MDALAEAQKLYQESLDDLSDQRRQIEEDLRFTDPSKPEQWDDEEKRQRENDPGGSRPCLVMDQIGQYISNVAGQIEQRPPSLHAIPAADGADQRTAEKLDGFFRQIEQVSRSSQHYTRALTSAARVGVGYLIVRPDYVNRALGYQEPRIYSEGDPLRVVFDPWSVEMDGSDATFGFLLTPFSHREFERKFGEKAEKISFGDDDRRAQEDERESVLVAESWRIDDQTNSIIVFTDEKGQEDTLPEEQYWQASKEGRQLKPIRTFKDKTRKVLWSRMSGAAILTEETEYPADSIGIVPCYGYVAHSNGRMTYCGMGRRARYPQQAYNFHSSEIRAYMNQAPKSPWIVPLRALIDGNIKSLWDRASVDSRAYLPYKDMDEEGAIAPPTRNSPAVNLQNHMAGLLQAKEDIQAAIGMYQANLGAPSNETSGIAIDSRKQQGEAATANFPSHLSASIAQVGQICMQMIPRLIDTKRQLRILGIDQTPGKVTLDPKQKDAYAEIDEGLSINPNVGRYDVRVIVGASFSTQRQQAQQAYTEMMRANPQMMPAIAPLWAQTLDVPHADKLAQVLTAMAPDPVKAILQPQDDKTPKTADLLAKINQLQQGMQEAIQHAHDAQGELDKANEELASVKGDKQIKAKEVDIKAQELEINSFDAETRRLVALGTTMKPEDIQALAQQTIAQAMAQPDPDQDAEDEMNLKALEALMQKHEELSQGNQKLAQSQQSLAEQMAGHQQQVVGALTNLHKLLKAPRKRIPVRDKNGDITQVIDSIEEPQEQQ